MGKKVTDFTIITSIDKDNDSFEVTLVDYGSSGSKRVDPQGLADSLSQLSGYSGSSVSGYSGYSGCSGSGYSGYSGYSGFKGETVVSGYSGYSGKDGEPAGRGNSGYSGYSGFAGNSGYSGYGTSGTSGYSGIGGNTVWELISSSSYTSTPANYYYDGSSFTAISAWSAGTKTSGTWVRPTTDNTRLYKCVTAGTTGASDPTGSWTTSVGQRITDGTVVWEVMSKHVLSTSIDLSSTLPVGTFVRFQVDSSYRFGMVAGINSSYIALDGSAIDGDVSDLNKNSNPRFEIVRFTISKFSNTDLNRMLEYSVAYKSSTFFGFKLAQRWLLSKAHLISMSIWSNTCSADIDGTCKINAYFGSGYLPANYSGTSGSCLSEIGKGIKIISRDTVYRSPYCSISPTYGEIEMHDVIEIRADSSGYEDLYNVNVMLLFLLEI